MRPTPTITLREALEAFEVSGASPYGGRLLHARGYNWKVVDRKLEGAVRRGYLECGVSPWSGWLTDKGREALRALKDREREGR